ncbi:hypothetical protein C6560_09515 [Enterobacter sp. FS01]|nr:hypothetical protein C6560_09515 [Enterobacter sp. FS01]
MWSSQDTKKALPVWVLGALYILPLIITNSQYYDDIGRSVYGYFSWGIDGRPLSDVVFMALDIGSPATDIAPYPQIAAVMLLSTLCYLIHRYLNPEHRFGWLVFTPIFMSPFFVQNLAFRFDSITMALSVVSAITPLMFIRSGGYKSFLCSLVGVLISLCFYQASLSIFVGMVCLYVIFSIERGEQTRSVILNTLIAAAGMLVGYALYSKFVVPMFVTSSYASGYNHTIGSFSELETNIRTARDIIKTLMNGAVGKLYLLTSYLAAIGLAALIFRILISRTGAINRVTRTLLVLLSVAVIFVCIPGPGLALKEMPIGPRVFVGFGLASALLLSLISFIIPKHEKLNSIFPVILALVSFSFMGTFTNSVSAQDKLADRIINGVMVDMNNAGFMSIKTITVDGRPPYSPQADKATMKYPLLKQLVPNYFDGVSAWGVVKMTAVFAGRPQPEQAAQAELISRICDMRLISDADLYRTYIDDKGNFLISFNRRDCK